MGRLTITKGGGAIWPVASNPPRKRFVARFVSPDGGRVLRLFPTRRAAHLWLEQKATTPRHSGREEADDE